MDERIMHILSLIADQVQTRADLFHDEGRIMDSLMNSGYRLYEADAALTLMQSLALTGTAVEDAEPQVPPIPMRAMSTRERSRFTIESFGFITKLAALGIITEEQREELIEKASALHRNKVSLEEIKALVAVDLFTNTRHYEDLLASIQERHGSMWN